MGESTLKGTAVKPNIDWMKKTYGETVWDQIEGRLSEEQRSQLKFISGATMYPTSLLSSVNEAFVDVACRGDRQIAGEAFRKMGHYIADDNLGGVYSLFVRFASPDKVLSRLPNIVSTMYSGVTARYEADADGRGATVQIFGLGGLTYAGPRLAGWAESALEKVGARDVRVRERSWDAGAIASDEITLVLRWS